MSTDADYLRDLAARLRSIPVMYGTDEGDVDRLQSIADGLPVGPPEEVAVAQRASWVSTIWHYTSGSPGEPACGAEPTVEDQPARRTTTERDDVTCTKCRVLMVLPLTG